MPTLPARLLVDMPTWLGDFVHTLPALARMIEGNARGRTTVLLPAPHARIARLLGVHTIARPAGVGFTWARRELHGAFDVALTARHATRAKLLLRGVGAPLGLASRGRGSGLLGLTTFAVDRSRHQRHDLDSALRRLRLAAVDDSTWQLKLPAGEAGKVSAEPLPPGTVALLPGSQAMPAKRYPVEGFAALARKLDECGVPTVAVVGPGQEPLADAIAAASGARALPVAPLDEVAVMFAACSAVVGNDSGLTHLASVVGCPTIALFGPTDPARTSPVGGGIVIQAPRRSLPEIDPSQITATLLAVLASRRDDHAGGSPRPA